MKKRSLFACIGFIFALSISIGVGKAQDHTQYFSDYQQKEIVVGVFALQICEAKKGDKSLAEALDIGWQIIEFKNLSRWSEWVQGEKPMAAIYAFSEALFKSTDNSLPCMNFDRSGSDYQEYIKILNKI